MVGRCYERNLATVSAIYTVIANHMIDYMTQIPSCTVCSSHVSGSVINIGSQAYQICPAVR